MLRLLFVSAAAAALMVAQPAAAGLLHASAPAAGGSSPLVTPGAAPPNVDTATRIVTASYNDITPASHGDPADYGYAIRGGMRWTSIPWVEVGSPGVSATRHVSFVAWHVPTDTDLVAGLDSNIASAKVRCDGGPWSVITGPSANPDSGQDDWNFQVRSQDFADGLHKCDLLISPATGPDIIADGPASDPYGWGLEEFKASQAIISDGSYLSPGSVMTVFQAMSGTDDVTLLNWHGQLNPGNGVAPGQSVAMMGVAPNTFVASLGTGTGRAGTYNVTGAAQLAVGAKFTGSISGTTLTVSAVTQGNLQVNNFVAGSGVTPVQIIGSADANPTFCTPDCTGHSTTGTYALAGSAQSVGSEAMVTSAPAIMNVARSYYFLTNFHGTLARPTVYVSLTGSDSNIGTDYQHPFLTISKALVALKANGVAAGIYGGTVCLMGGGSFTYGTFADRPWASNGWQVYQSADQAPCNAPGDPGGASITQAPSMSNRDFYALHTMWRYVNFLGGSPDNHSGGDGQYLAADHVTQVHDTLGNGGLLGGGAAYCADSTSWFGHDGLCSAAMLVRGSSAKYYTDDGQHDVAVSVGNTFDAGGNVFKWVTGTTTIGSNVITNVALGPSELAGYSLSSIFAGYGNLNALIPGVTNEQGCLGGAWPLSVSAVDDVNHTITLVDDNGAPANATANCVGAVLYEPGAHADNFQLQVTNAFGDIYVAHNSWDATYQGWHQGEFIETAQISGGYIGHNDWRKDPLDEHRMLLVKGGNENLINAHNTYSAGAKDWNLQQASVGDTLVEDQCSGGGFTVDTPGANQRVKAAASSAC